MSMDWTPSILYQVDKKMKEEDGESLRDVNFKLCYDGKEEMLVCEDAKKAYPELSFLCSGFQKLFQQHKDNRYVHAVFDEMEKALETVETQLETKREEPGSLSLYELSETDFYARDIRDVMQEWFYGRLDPNFYYHNRNDDMLMMYLDNKMYHRPEKKGERAMDVFKDLFHCCFNEDFTVKACGRECTKKLISAAKQKKPGIDFGNETTGMMNAEAIISLYREL